MMKKALYILRHAKAESATSGKEDRERGLSSRGIKAAEAMGKYMAEQDIRPDKVLCSTALRARETWEMVERQYPLPLREGEGGGATPPSLTLPLKGGGDIEYIDKLYLASANEMLQLIAKTPESVPSLMLVGHNPGMHQLALALAQEGDQKLRERLQLKFPTAALATIVFSGAWVAAARARGTLQGFTTPKMLGIVED